MGAAADREEAEEAVVGPAASERRFGEETRRSVHVDGPHCEGG